MGSSFSYSSSFLELLSTINRDVGRQVLAKRFKLRYYTHHFRVTMAENSAQEPLLSNSGAEYGVTKRTGFSACFAKWVLKILMWVIFIAWIALIFFYPSEFEQHFFSKWIVATKESIFGVAGSIFLIFSAPILIVAFLAYIYVTAFPSESAEVKKSKFPRFRLWTFPILVNGPFGVVTAGEMIGILLVSAYIIWAVSAYSIQIEHIISEFSVPSKLKCCLALDILGARFGIIGLFCLSLLFLPVARGSVLLRLIDIPFEHATRYHVWMGHLTMTLFTLHGLCYVISWSMQGNLIHELLEWDNIGIAILPGVISLLAGLLMWVTSLHPVRRDYFDLFFYTHQLYVVFVVFLALHVGDFIFSMAAGGIFLFLLDRVLRFWQSRTTVDVLSATCRPCGTIELVLSKPKNMRYNALSFIFLQVRELSWLQWHPFSVSSSPLDGRHHISILIKVLGEWTRKLRESISNVSENPQNGLPFQPCPRITASVEGPYGHEAPYHLTYEYLILVAGGIGISPFLAILSDILQRISMKKSCLPKNVLIVWAVKKSKELSLLSAINTESICPAFSDHLNLEIQTYITQESEPSLEEGKLYQSEDCPFFSVVNGRTMSSLVGTGNNILSGAYVILSTLGFVILLGLVDAFYVKPFNVSSWWFQGLLFTMCMIASVVIFGGLVVFLWNHWEKSVSKMDGGDDGDDEKSQLTEYNEWKTQSNASQTNLADTITTRYGCRPNFQEIFNSVSEHWGRVDVGVIICGPPTLQSSVAKECRSQNIRGRWNRPIFHFHSHSFDL